MRLTKMKSIESKVLLIIGSVFLFSMLFMIGIAHCFILHSFEEIEEESNRKDLSRVSNFIREDLINLRAQVSDWAEWNDTYDFIDGEDSGYAKSNLNSNTLSNLGLNLMLFLDIEGRIVSQLYMPPGKKELEPINEEFVDALSGEGYPISDLYSTEGKSGFLNFHDSLLMISSWPILTTNSEGPARGTLILGKIMDDHYLSVLAQKMHIILSCDSCSGMNVTEVPFYAIDLRGKKTVIEWPLVTQKKEQLGYISLKNPKGDNMSVIRISFPRNIYLHGRQTVINFLFLFFSVMIIHIVIMTLILDRNIVSRISVMEKSLRLIAKRADLKGRVIESGNDEITSLSKSINHMIRSIARVLENIPDPLLLSEEDGKILFMNETGQDVTGYEKNELVSLMMGRLTGLFYAEDYRIFWNDLMERRAISFEASVIRRDGSNFPVEFHSTLFSLGEQRFALSVIRDITKRKQYEFELSEKAFRDPLTGLANRYLFNDRMKMTFEKYRRNHKYNFALMMIDLDHFKEINDTLGHPDGDVFLSQVASRLVGVTRLEDTLARWGGDEFVLLVQNVSKQKELTSLIRRIEKMTQDPVLLHSKAYPISFSMGIAIHTFDIKDPEELVSRADDALYEAKKRRKERISFTFFCDYCNHTFEEAD